MASPNSPGELKWYHLVDREVLARFVINLPKRVSDELQWIHFIDRELFSRLVIDLRRDIRLVMKAIALWIWLEEIGYPNIIEELLQQLDLVVLALTGEALKCIYYIETARIPPPPPDIAGDLPLTQALMKREISLRFFYDNRYNAMLGMTKVMNDVCAKVFGDIVQRALAQPGPSGEGSSRAVGGVGGAGDRDNPVTPNVEEENFESSTDEANEEENSESSTDEESSPSQTMGIVGGNDNVEEEISESSTDEESFTPQTMGIVGGSTNVVPILHGIDPWGIRSQHENSESSQDEEQENSESSTDGESSDE